MNNEAFDWNLAVARANGNKDLAYELSGLLVENIKECVPDLKNAWLKKDLESLRHLSHKMHGGAAYTGAIGIQNASKNFEKALVSGEISQTYYQQFLKSMEDFSVYFESVD